MTEQKVFDSKFHRWYVGGEGAIAEERVIHWPSNEIIPQTYEQILEEYRKCVNVRDAQLPEEIMEELRKIGKI